MYCGHAAGVHPVRGVSSSGRGRGEQGVGERGEGSGIAVVAGCGGEDCGGCGIEDDAQVCAVAGEHDAHAAGVGGESFGVSPSGQWVKCHDGVAFEAL